MAELNTAAIIQKTMADLNPTFDPTAALRNTMADLNIAAGIQETVAPAVRANTTTGTPATSPSRKPLEMTTDPAGPVDESEAAKKPGSEATSMDND
ncbi:hypothetical protein [Nocardia sp. NPDC050710]|uniref:hypothetical protein n=1 Tax=Nocardia sp. NPDC050710 TaxID=3157220 RepID=UPI0033D78CE0